MRPIKNLIKTGIIAFLLWQQAFAQINTSQGFVQQENIKISGILTDAQIYPLNNNQKQTTRTYIDGLGRPIQSVSVQASPLQNDLIQPVVYDNLGRQTTGYLPYAGQATDIVGSYRANALTGAQAAFYNNTAQFLIATDAAPFTQKVFENSPLQRLLQSGTIGSGYQPGVSGAHLNNIIYRANNSTDGNIMQWNPDGTYTTGTYYPVNSLAVTDAKDADGIEALIFTDLEGHTILKRQILQTGNLDTYYIYNIAGMPIFVVPPKAVALLAASNYNLTVAPLSNLVFSYVYNSFGLPVQKTVPGQGVLYTVYDPLNRPLLMQDANMRANNNWNYIKYDVKGRAISQGIYNDASHIGLAAMQAYVNTLNYSTTWFEQRSAAGTTTGYYTNSVFPTTGITPLAYSYFDDYDLKQNGTPFTYVNQGLAGEAGATTASIKGAPTMVWKTTVGSGLSGTWLLQVIFYDKRGNAIQTRSNNHVYYTGSATLTDAKTNVPDFMGVPQITKVIKQTAASTTTTVLTTLTYDQAYRVTSIAQAYNGGTATTVATYNYNELGQIIKKNLGQLNTNAISTNLTLNTTYGGTNTFTASNSITLAPGFSVPTGSVFKASITTNYLQSVDFRYNIRGQLLSINNSKLSNDGGVTNTHSNDLFGMQLLYDQQDSNLGNNPSYDGKLTAVKWMSRDASGNISYERGYKYNYDQLNRYTGENYAERATASTGAFNNNIGGFDETGITYDAGGNILTLLRNASTQGANSNVQIDNLAYTYSTTNPNQLLNVTDGTDANHTGAGFRNSTSSTASYTYDVNGNLTADPYKGLSIAYNFLKRTDKITITTAINRYITYTYDAGGTLLRKQAYDNNTLQTTTDYVEGFVYINNALSYFPMPEGRVLNNGGTLKQEFIITDQQGNARLSFQDNGSGVALVKQENSYYGFGMLLPNSPVATPTTPNKQLYNGGSEWQNDFSNLPDYQQTFYRNYDAALGRWVAVDPMAESAESLTTYQYAGNNPILANDPMGNLIKDPPSSNGAWNPFQSIMDGYMNINQGVGLHVNSGPLDATWQDSPEFGGKDYLMEWRDILGGYGASVGVDGVVLPSENINTNNGQAASSSNTGSTNTAYSESVNNAPYLLSSSNYSVSNYSTNKADNDKANKVWLDYIRVNLDFANSGGVQEWSVYNRYDSDLKEDLYGMKFTTTVNISAYSKYNFTSYNWISVVTRTPKAIKGGITLDNPIYDGTIVNGKNVNYPYYFTNADPQYIFGNWILFADYPGMPYKNGTFSAVTTLVGINGTTATPILSYSWGYQVTNGVTTLSPSSPNGPVPNIILKP